MLGSVSGDVGLWLGLYATVISTAVALLTLYGEIFQRVSVRGRESYVVAVGGDRYYVMAPDAVEDLEVPAGAVRRPVLTLVVRNRGRQTVSIDTVSKAYWFKIKRQLFDEAVQGGSFTLQPGHSHTLTVGTRQKYAHGAVGSMRRFFVVDGAGRIHPPRERWRQRLENLLYRRWVMAARRHRRRRQIERQGVPPSR
jgi:hypothetical protein